MNNKIFFILRSGVWLLSIGLCVWGCTYDQNAGPEIPEPPEQEFIGTAECATCHSNIYDSFVGSGHNHILSKVEGGQAPDYPNTILDHLPAGYTWNDISYVIGGFNWKANYIDADGYIVTGEDAQWNFETGVAAAYQSETNPGTQVYDCGMCHATGWKSISEGGNPQDDLDGMGGSFFEAGVQCERCHGMGALHKHTRSKDYIEVDPSAELCGNCHRRDNSNTLQAKDGFIRHYQQYSEMMAAGHSELTCGSCHDPHASTKGDQAGGIIASCTDCHADVNNKHEPRGADCVTCHMSLATKSAVAKSIYQADMMTHIFKINTAADGNMFNEDGTIADGSSGVTLDRICYKCHKDPNGQGGTGFYSRKSMEELSAYATGYHD